MSSVNVSIERRVAGRCVHAGLASWNRTTTPWLVQQCSSTLRTVRATAGDDMTQARGLADTGAEIGALVIGGLLVFGTGTTLMIAR